MNDSPNYDPYVIERFYNGINQGSPGLVGDFSPFLDTRDGTNDFSQNLINEYIVPNARANPLGKNQQQRIINAIDAQRLQPFDMRHADTSDPEVMRSLPQAVYDPSRYGDLQVFPFLTVAGIDQVVLQRPRAKRVYLLIQVQGGGTLTFTFDQDSTNGGIQLPAGSSIIFDSIVPQNDLHISGVGSTGVIAFINVDSANAR